MTTQDPQVQFASDLNVVLESIYKVLTEKNRKYGDAALNPSQTFSSCSAIELINVRIDDKLSRIRNRQNDEDEDPELDLLGYLILKQIAKHRVQQANSLTSVAPFEPMPGLSPDDIRTVELRVLDRYKIAIHSHQASDALYKHLDVEKAICTFNPNGMNE